MTQPAASDIRVGAVLQDTYEITSLLGKGGMGEVFLARHRRLPGRQVAVKVLQNSASLNPELYARFRREAEIATQLGHPNIVEVLDFDTLQDGTPFLIMEYLRGESLEHRLLRGRLPLTEALAITRQIGSALQAAHRAGVVHRDLKPANVFLVPTDSGGVVGERVKLLDFGISKMLDSKTLQTQEAVLIGTPQYMAPEQALGKNSEVDARTDLFALGCIVYEMLSGTPPFAGEGGSIVQVIFRIVHTAPEPLSTRCPDLPERVLTAVERALAKTPQDRYPDVATFIEALTGSPLQSLSGTAPVPSFARPAPSSAEEGGFAATHMPSGTARFPAPATPVAGAEEGGFAATHMPSGTARFPAPTPAAAADDVGFAATHMPSGTARFPAPAPAAATDDVGFAATLVPSSTARIPAPVAAPSPVSPAPAPPPPVVAPSSPTPEIRRARAKPIIPLALGAMVVILGVGVVWFGGRSTPVPASSAPESVAVSAPVPQVAPTPQPAPPPETKAPPAPAPEAVPSAPVASPATPAAPVVESTPTPKPASQGKREVISEAVQADLKEAESALAANQYQDAIRVGLRILRKEGVSATEAQAAESLLARAYCRQSDLSAARAHWRRLSREGRREVRQYCKQYLDLL